jgi:hypothetical protein
MHFAPNMKSKLRDLMARTNDPLGGFVYFIGLDEIRADLGARWEAKRENIEAVAKRTIRAEISSDDVFFPYGDGEYVILFSNLDRERALVKCAVIKAEILRQFRGDADLSALDIQTKVASLADGSIETVSLQKVLADMRADGQGADGDEVQRGISGPSSRAPAGTGAFQGAQDHSSTPNHQAGAPRPKDFHMWGVAGQDGDIGSDPTLAIFGNRVEDLMKDVRVGYAPLVYPAKRTISIFHCTPYRADRLGGIVGGHDLLDSSPPETAVVELDMLAVERGRIALVEMLRRNTIAVLAISLGFETLSRRAHRNDVLVKLAEIPQEFRRYLVINLRRLPSGLPSSRLLEICMGFKPLVRSITAEVDPQETDFSMYRTAGVSCIGFSLYQRFPVPVSRHRWISRFPWKAKRHDLNSAVYGLRSETELAEAAQAGYEYFGGPAVGPLRDAPGPVSHFRLPNTSA